MLKLKCNTCGVKLRGRQRKFCGLACKNADTNNRHQNYVTQQGRGIVRRLMLIAMKGGECERCGYRENFAALSFHHNGSGPKLFSIDLRACSNKAVPGLLAEVAKCDLLCLNCHAEEHHPTLSGGVAQWKERRPHKPRGCGFESRRPHFAASGVRRAV